MTQHSLQALLLAGVVLLAGCAGGLSGAPGSPSTSDSGTVAFYISDEENAIEDFRHLNVTVSKIGFERTAAEDGGWIEHEVDNRSVDLTELQGANATLLEEYDVPNGTYGKVFVHVSEVNATLENGEQVRVKLPSEKLQLEKEFAVENGSEVDFVFDITVHRAGNSGKYILTPVVSESGTDVPIESIDEDDREDELTATFVTNVSQGENATIEVTRDGEPVANATVVVNDESVGATDAEGRLTFEVPDEEEVEVEVTTGDAEGELEVEFESDDDREDDDADEELTASFVGNVSQGENATLRVTRNGTPVEDATVVVNDESAGTTDADGHLTFDVPDEESLTVSVEVEDEAIELEHEFESDDDG